MGLKIAEQTNHHMFQVTVHVPMIAIRIAPVTPLAEVFDCSPIGQGVDPMAPESPYGSEAHEGSVAVTTKRVEAQRIMHLSLHSASPRLMIASINCFSASA